MKPTINIRDIALKNLLLNKMRTLLMIMTVALSVSLIVLTLTYFYSDDVRQKQSAINEMGPYHLQYDSLTEEQLRNIVASKSISRSYKSSLAREIEVNPFSELDINMAVLNTEGINTGLLELSKGRAPTAVNEIVLDEWVIQTLGLPLEVNQKIQLTIKAHETESFVIVGIMGDIAVRKAANAGLMLVSERFIEKYSPKYETNLFVLLNTDYNASQLGRSIGEKAGLNSKQIKINERYTGAYETDASTIISAIFLLFFIVIVAATVIFNIFYIYISQKIRQFGILKAIGATPWQLRSLIYLEGMFIGLLGSIAGLMGGSALGYLFIPFMGNSSNLGATLYVATSPYILLFAFILGVIMVLISIGSPARKVARISEIEAIQYNPTQIMTKKMNTSKFNHKVTMMTLIEANFSRNRKRTVITILSLTLTGLIFIVAASILSSMNIGNMAASMVQGDYKLSGKTASRTDNPLNGSLMNEIKNMDGITDIHTEMYDDLIYNAEDATRHIILQDQQQSYAQVRANLYGYNDSLVQIALNGLNNGTTTLDEMRNNHNVIALTDENRKYKIGDKVRVTTFEDVGKEIELTIVGTVPTYITYKGSESDGGILIAHQNLFKELSLDQRVQQLSVSADGSNKEQVEHALKEIANSQQHIQFTSFEESFNEFNTMKQVIQTAAYSFVAALILISIFNLVNSSVSSVLSRIREISMLEAVGLSNYQLFRMLLAEGLVYIIISLGLILGIGLPAGYFLVQLFKKEATYAVYQFPILPIVILIACYGLTQLFVTLYLQRMLYKTSLIERMKYVE
ncbi:FtsX-like permease family protein [Paenibacillus glacialis]|uniref:ABC3 transporter permease C-terminal domain-containing protein n=1 Tax=Paenibacillus glacialis TaxID=494026 RepID=A0A168ML38_9BACL|nr:FtsX-like permease family protein [Paenibacillus glacialis]OAB44803.1 hypothetical protein PGLA_05165 [Paenibacillus glacialis]